MFSALGQRLPNGTTGIGKMSVQCSTSGAIIFPTASTNNGMQAVIGYDTINADDFNAWDKANFCYRVKKRGWYYLRNGIRTNQTTSMEVLTAYTKNHSYVYATVASAAAGLLALSDSPIGVSYYSASSETMFGPFDVGDVLVPTAYSPVQLTQHSIIGGHYGFLVVGPF